ncbi:hypothetical protein HC251_11625 [Iamia sp. SCSIO 61187]|uniref:hypothetical protein n=1 Tax=Iamia sp. SCSIO 61187 TaxID=2722752 RepID=UPI001C634214|nr:hypothetical protein [Iamia sp. SCSIO 61187]QYG93017.1 hypothetical protein HC251_11625 [Iamia sp. SCSIO 61187]
MDHEAAVDDGPASGPVPWWVVAVLVVVPVVVLVGALAQRTWYPTGDQAQAELRMLSLPEHVPLVGAAGRIVADDGTQGNHPGPLMFWTTWPLYRLLGGSSWAFAAATALVNAAGLAASVAVVARRGGRAVTLGWGAVALVMVGGFGLDAVSQPWNPWVALVPFLLLLLSCWAVLDGDRWPLVLAVAGGSYALQGHAGYAPLVPPLLLLATVVLVVRERPRDRADVGAAARRLAPLPVAVLVGLVLWSGPLVDAVTNDPSNVRILLESFGSPDAGEEVLGPADGIRAVLQASDPLGPWLRGTTGVGGSVLPGLALLGAWATVAVVVAVRRLHPTLTRLNVVLGAALVLGTLAVSRVFGALYLYTFRWIVVLVAVVVLTLGWGVAVVARAQGLRPPDARGARRLGAVAVAALVALSALTAVRLVGEEIPYRRAWRAEAELARQVVPALAGDDRTYLVRWEDQVYLGGLGFGLVLALERDGVRVGVDPAFSAAAEPHRVLCPGEYDAVVMVVTGQDGIDRWRARPDAREVGLADVRSPAEQRAGERDREALARALSTEGEVVDPDQIDGLLSVLVLDPAQPPEVVALASRLVEAGVPTAAFVVDAPPEEPPSPDRACP